MKKSNKHSFTSSKFYNLDSLQSFNAKRTRKNFNIKTYLENIAYQTKTPNASILLQDKK